jgi:hypothetical protein
MPVARLLSNARRSRSAEYFQRGTSALLSNTQKDAIRSVQEFAAASLGVSGAAFGHGQITI